MRFVFGTNESFAMPTGIAIRSLDRHLDESDEVLVLHTGLHRATIAKISECAGNASVRTVDASTRLHPSWPVRAPYSAATFLRLLIPEYLPGAHRCIYLDGDVLVRRNPELLYRAELHGRTFGAVRSRTTPFVASKDGIPQWSELGLRSSAPYFNAGVLVCDLDRWRERELSGHATAFLQRYGKETTLPDQDALNVAAVDDWTEMDRTWNYVTYITDYFLQQPESEPPDPAIIHFAGPAKPWSAGPQPMFAEEWHELLRDSPWAGFTPPPPPSGPRIRIRRTASRFLRRLKDLSKE